MSQQDDSKDSWYDQFSRDRLIESTLNGIIKNVFIKVEILRDLIADEDWDSKRKKS